MYLFKKLTYLHCVWLLVKMVFSCKHLWQHFFDILKLENLENACQDVRNRTETTLLNCHFVLVWTFPLFLSTLRVVQVRDLWIDNLPQVLFDMRFHVVISFRKSLLNHFPFGHDTYVRFTIFHHIIIIKPNNFLVHINPINLYGSIKCNYEMQSKRVVN